jgi:hypothetical protein
MTEGIMRAVLIASVLLLTAAPAAAQTSTPGTYIDRWTLGTTNSFIGRIQIATAVTSSAVLEEAGTTPNHTNRLALAKTVLKEPEFLARRIAPMIAASIPVTSTDDGKPETPPIIDTTWTDAQIQTLIDNKWNVLASAFAPPATLLTAEAPLPPGAPLVRP